MKTRIISSIIGLVLLAFVMISGKLILGIAVAFIAFIGLFEFYSSVANAGYKPIKILGYISSLAILFIAYNEQIELISQGKLPSVFALSLFIMAVVMFCIMIFSNNKYSVVDMAITLFGVFYVVFLFAFVLLTRDLKDGQYYIWLVFIGAWMTDTCAYFTGRLIGKTKKFIPAIVPTKTLEGCLEE